ncbi:protein ERGIC-53-like isoform X1 [Ovis aries]|uniref:protein ERGIC-53-like isoform X1 n=1 Tax=Ovis aries TaxID=9940 RepID=UPI00100F9A23|nr:protein ERGIC-53-like isoform X1 [Ovis aries]
MRVVCGLDPLLCLLLLLLLDPHSPEGGHLPQRRFEYKLSFKGPRLALPGVGIPFWSHHGDAIPGLEEVRLAPSMRNRSGAVWSTTPVLFPAWEVEIQMRVTGPGRRGAQGMAMWYTQGRGQVGPVLGAPDLGDGIGILFDSSAQDAQNSPAIHVLATDRHILYEPLGDGGSLLLGSCRQDFRNRPYPFRARITYWGQRLRVSLNSGLTPSDPDEVCVDVGPLLLAPGGFFGVSAATSILADDHDVLSFLTFSLWEPGPEPPSQPFLEMEQLHLAKQLEGLRATLGLGTKEDMTPKLNYGVQEDGEQSSGLEETLHRHSQILQALQGLSKHLAQAERQWKQQLGSPGQIRPEGGWRCSCSHGLKSPGLLPACGHQAPFLRAGPDPEPPAEGPAGPSESSSQGPSLTWQVPKGFLVPAAWHLSVLPPHPDCRLLLLCTLQQAEAGQGPSGLFVHMQPSSEFYTTNPQGPGGSSEAALLPQHTGVTYFEALMKCPLLITRKSTCTWGWTVWLVSSAPRYLAPTHTLASGDIHPY